MCWVFSDTKEPINDTCLEDYLKRPCVKCGKHPTKEGHDSCLGTLIGVEYACCGHGNVENAYVQFLDSNSIHGEDAIIIQKILKKHSKENYV